jgi:hypothetical protein
MQKKKDTRKQFTESRPSIGLGDTIQKVTKATGIELDIPIVKIDGIDVKEIPNYEGYYITKNGEVFSNRGRWGTEAPKKLKATLQNGYPSVTLYKTGNKGSGYGDTLYVHRLLADAFIDKIEGKTFVNHKDGNKENNALDNLEWVTQQENNLHAFQTGLMTQLKYTKEQHLEVLDRYHVKGQKQVDIANEMGVPTTFVNDLIGRGTGVRSQGLGDDIERFLNQPLIKPITEKVKKLIWKDSEDCGCDARKHKLNKIFPNRKPLCMTEGEYDWFTHFKTINSTTLSPMEADHLSKMWSRIFQSKRIYKPCTCNPKAWQTMINELTQVYETYQVQE